MESKPARTQSSNQPANIQLYVFWANTEHPPIHPTIDSSSAGWVGGRGGLEILNACSNETFSALRVR